MLESLICVWLLRDISCFRYSTRKEKNAFGDRLEKRKILNCISDLRSNYKSVFTIKDRCLDYERYTLYWIFNGAAIWCFLELADKDFLKS